LQLQLCPTIAEASRGLRTVRL